MFWFLSDFVRVENERIAIEKLASEVTWLQNATWKMPEGALELWADIVVGDRIFPVRLVYPAIFPTTPPSVFPSQEGERWSSHQYGSGELCLEWGPDNWRPSILGANVIESAYRLLSLEMSGNVGSNQLQIPNRHIETRGQKLRSAWCRFYYDSDTVAFLKNHITETISKFEIVETAATNDPVEICAFIKSITLKDGTTWTNRNLPKALLKQVIGNADNAFGKTTKDLAKNVFKSRLEAEQDIGISLVPGAEGTSGFILILDGNFSLSLYYEIASSSTFLQYESNQIALSQDTQRLGNEYQKLKDKSIAIIGLGSAGSKIALSLARCGINRFFLIDDDVFFPENICRNALDWNDIGHHKVSAVRKHLYQISPDIECKICRIKLSGQEASSSVSSIIRQFENYDIIIDATANPSTFNILARFCETIKKPLVWLEVFAGGIGGLIARYRSGIEPSPFDMRQQYHELLVEHDAPDIKAGGNYTATDINGNVTTATDADVTFISSSALELVIDTLLARSPSAFPSSMYLLGLRKEWLFSQPFVVIPLEIRNFPTGSKVNEKAPANEDGEIKSKSLSFLADLIKDKKNEN